MFLVSKCCAGVPCRYRGNGYMRKVVIEAAKAEDFVAVCPEMLGGLPCPREGCDVSSSGTVVGRKSGKDYTAPYALGAQKVLDICLDLGIERAFLLSSSPSCGKGYGITAKLLEEHGIEVVAI